MPDFSVSLVDGAEPTVWLDPPTAQRPTRINPTPGHPHLRYVATLPAIQVFLVDDTGSFFFATTAWLAEAPGAQSTWPVATTSPSPASVQFIPKEAGHHVLVIRHDEGGSIIMHFDVEAP